MDTRNIRISNLPREELIYFWKRLSPPEMNELIFNSNNKEIDILFGHMSEKGIVDTIQSLEPKALTKVLKTLPPHSINKLFMFANVNLTRKMISDIDRDLLLDILRSSNPELRDRILKSMPTEQRKMFLELSEEQSEMKNDYKYFMSDEIEKSSEKDAFNRLKELEDRERFLERKQRAREEQYSVQLDNLRQQITVSEKEIYQKQNKHENIAAGLLKKEHEIRDNIRLLQEEHQKEHQKQVQKKIEIKVPEFVESAVEVLKEKERIFSDKAATWNFQGSISLGLAIASAVGALIYGGFEFNSAAKENIDWFFFSFLLLKGLIIVSLFGAFAKHAYNTGNAYMHESLQRSDRMHAINFGKLYLEVYGNDVTQNDMKSIFENWNMSSDSAFTKIPASNFEPKVVEQVTQMIKAVSTATQNGEREANQPLKQGK
jgi:ribosomal protein L12E/L44/L45/RPP1/RPP2